MTTTDELVNVLVSFRDIKVEMPLNQELTVESVKRTLIQEQARRHDDASLQRHDLKVLYQGKILNDADNLFVVLLGGASGKTKSAKKMLYRLVVTGISSSQAQAMQHDLQQASKSAPRIRDDLSPQGQAEVQRRQRLGQHLMQKVAAKNSGSAFKYGFGRIAVLPNLPNQDAAHDILTRLANDPGILACMAKHQWNVGCLAELYPDGKVGQSAVCVMGLNENKGQRILLRLRTDNLQGFRKILSIRKVLYHELAHNVHSEHDGDFFQLMRQIERECTDLDWTQGKGLTSYSGHGGSSSTTLYTGGTFRLGGSITSIDRNVPLRELAAQAALSRMTAEEEEIQANCGCGRQDLFLPPKSVDSSSSSSNNSSKPSEDMQDDKSHILN